MPFNPAPVGLGPFTFVRRVRGDRIEFVRDDDRGKPKIARIVWRLVPDENTEMQPMRTKPTDVRSIGERAEVDQDDPGRRRGSRTSTDTKAW